eukprot:CFRG0820T1
MFPYRLAKSCWWSSPRTSEIQGVRTIFTYARLQHKVRKISTLPNINLTTHHTHPCTAANSYSSVPKTKWFSTAVRSEIQVACAFQGKPRRPKRRPAASDILGEKDESVSNCASVDETVQSDSGEDAYFVQETSEAFYIGVADGVGGWAGIGVDPSLFAWALMNNAKNVIANGLHLAERDALEYAHNTIMKKGEITHGSSTACVLRIDKETHMLTGCNLGDSGFQIYTREGKFIGKSKSQQHGFNFPYQLSVMPSDMSKGAILHTMKEGDAYRYQMNESDIVVLATDGLFDNLFPQDIEEIIKREGAQDVSKLASEFVKCAKNFSDDPNRRSPFTEEAENHGINDMIGGKPDDITVIVGTV